MEHYTCEHFNKPSRALEIRCEKCGEVYNVDNNASDIIRRNAEREADKLRVAA